MKLNKYKYKTRNLDVGYRCLTQCMVLNTGQQIGADGCIKCKHFRKVNRFWKWVKCTGVIKNK